jgi:hypothetical protein
MTIERPAMQQLLLDHGYTDGWAMTEETLTHWEHDEDPPAPLTRPEASDDLAD